jgi:hypothetical protein
MWTVSRAQAAHQPEPWAVVFASVGRAVYTHRHPESTARELTQLGDVLISVSGTGKSNE